MVDRRVFAHFDYLLFFVTVLLIAAGLATLYSATFTKGGLIYKKELYLLIVCSFFFAIAVLVNYALLERFAYTIFGLSILTLVLALLMGKTIGGAQRWLSFGGVSFQPSEVTKLALIIVLSKYFSEVPVPPKGLGFKELIGPVILLAVPFVLIVKQPDLGTALSLFLVFSSMVLMARVRLRVLVWTLIGFIPLIPIAWGSLKSYQKARVLSFLDPGGDPMGSGYHVLQSKIAIGSGGIWGKGFMQGTQGKLMFLPEHHTDFIFSVLAEEWGLVGSVTVIVLLFALILRGLNTAANTKDRFAFHLAFGIASMFFWHVVINLGMVTGLLPVVGIPLPFLSYGGSFLLTSLVSVGILINIRMRRFIF